MKKLIVFSVIFALIAGSVFAVDLGGEVIGTVKVLSLDSTEVPDPDNAGKMKAKDPWVEGGMNRVRLEGSGEDDDGVFGGWIRVDGVHWSGDPQFEGLAWWKPIDQFKLSIGGNSDGIYGKEGYAGWMFRQHANDTGIVKADEAWGSPYGLGAVFRDAFFGGFGGKGLMLDIKPIDVLGINLVLPFIDMNGATVEDGYSKIIAQVDVNLDFGNIALTFVGDKSELVATGISEAGIGDSTAPRVHLYFGLTAIENLNLDVGLGYGLPVTDKSPMVGGKDLTYNAPIALGLAAKYGMDAFAIRARVLMEVGGSIEAPGYKTYESPFYMTVGLLPSFSINDNLTVFVDLGLNIRGEDKYIDTVIEDSKFGFHFNPYVAVGSEWGPKFYAGINVWSQNLTPAGDADPVVNFEIPVALHLSF